MSYRKAITVEGLPPGWTAHYERSTNLNAETEHEVTAIHAVHGRVSVWGGGKRQDTDAALLAAVRKEFWARLQPFPWMHELLGLCREHAPTTLLTSPAPLPACHAGKAQWMQNTFGRDFRDYALTSVKHRFAHPGALLIDDSPKNCDAFRAHGGHAILFPGVGNDLHAVPGDNRVAYVREQLKGYSYS